MYERHIDQLFLGLSEHFDESSKVVFAQITNAELSFRIIKSLSLFRPKYMTPPAPLTVLEIRINCPSFSMIGSRRLFKSGGGSAVLDSAVLPNAVCCFNHLLNLSAAKNRKRTFIVQARVGREHK